MSNPANSRRRAVAKLPGSVDGSDMPEDARGPAVGKTIAGAATGIP